MKQSLNFGFIRVWKLPPDVRPRDVAGHFMQIQRNLQPLFTGHLAIAFNLLVQCRFRSHAFSIIQCHAAYNFKSESVTAPSEALVTWAAYFASTPRV